MADNYTLLGSHIPRPANLSPVLILVAPIVVLIGLRWPLVLAGLAAIGAVAGLLWAVKFTRLHPKWLILALLLNEAMSSVALIDDSIRPVLRYVVLALFCFPFLPAVLKTDSLRRGGFKLYLVYFLWGTITVTFSLYPVYSLGRVASAALVFVTVMTVLSNIRDEGEIYEIFGIFWIGSALIMLALLLSLALPSDLTWAADDGGIRRFSGLFNNPNQVGELVLTTIASAVIYWPAASRRTRWVIATSIALAVVFDALADSRSPFVAISIGLTLYAISKYRLRAVAVVATIFLGALIIYAGAGSGREYVTRGEVTSFTGRTDIWKYTVHAIKERPLTGWGYEVEGQIFQNRDFPFWEEVWDEGPRSSVHDGYLSRASGVGIPATLLWLFLILRPLKFGLFDGKVPRVLRDAVLVGAVPVLIMNLVESTAGDCRYSVGLLLAIIWALNEQYRLLSARSPRRSSARIQPLIHGPELRHAPLSL